MPYAWSWLGDHWQHGARRVELVRIATALILASSLGLLWLRDVVAVAAVVVLIFLANAAVVPLAEAAVAQRLTTPEGLDYRRYGRVRMWGSLGFISAVGVFGVLLQTTGIAALPWFLIAMFGLLAAAAWRLPRQAAAPGGAQAGAPGGIWRVLRQPEVAWFFAGVFFTVLAHTSLYAFFSLYLDALGYGKSAVGALWAVSVAVEIAFFWSQGHWFARWSAHNWLLAAALVSVLRFAAMATLRRQLAAAGADAMPARRHFRGPARGLHQHGQSPLPRRPARPRPGAVLDAGLRAVGRDRRRRRWRHQPALGL